MTMDIVMMVTPSFKSLFNSSLESESFVKMVRLLFESNFEKVQRTIFTCNDENDFGKGVGILVSLEVEREETLDSVLKDFYIALNNIFLFFWGSSDVAYYDVTKLSQVQWSNE